MKRFLNLKRGSKVEPKTKKPDEPELILHDAARNGRLEKISSIVKKDKSKLYDVDEKQQTPLHIAAYMGHVDAVKLLLSFGGKSWNV